MKEVWYNKPNVVTGQAVTFCFQFENVGSFERGWNYGRQNHFRHGSQIVSRHYHITGLNHWEFHGIGSGLSRSAASNPNKFLYCKPGSIRHLNGSVLHAFDGHFFDNC